MDDIIRVLKIIEYVGPRSVVESQLSRSLGDGTKVFGPNNSMTIRIATVGSYPEILAATKEECNKPAEEKYVAVEGDF